MKRVLAASFLVVLLTLSLPSAVRADVTITAAADTWVDVNDPTSHNEMLLYISYSYQDSTLKEQRSAYVRFDLSTLTYPVSDEVVVRIFVLLAPLPTVGELAIWSTSDDWDEALIWANRPAGIASLDTVSVGPSSAGWVEFTGAGLAAFINTQLSDAPIPGDGVASFLIRWATCTICTNEDQMIFEDSENIWGSGNLPQLFAPTPTSVVLTSFTGRPVPRGNLLTWETADERDCAGFNLYRSAQPQQAGVRLNDTVIPARGLGQGAVYEFLDDTALPGTPYYYTLLDVDMGGSETPHGPVRVVGWWTYLPLIECRR